jgi:hypothetical protein
MFILSENCPICNEVSLADLKNLSKLERLYFSGSCAPFLAHTKAVLLAWGGWTVGGLAFGKLHIRKLPKAVENVHLIGMF